ncbi:oligoendopeptidase F [Mycoplasmopsis verecunda]|uniref:Oligopeptidase F n=1 Tax=Mycoplasmopsis verecunda TaxID=171291 RepID=A0A1T4L7F9_9BACT|nr:oligoendopeptidase F [Mycoplasmopsis verecunda]WPB54768.1 oligoendopeptidase F [Mycoplasmopsis verecunda]SJZ50593.1 oligoendopeptidase F [Mycoplasmopsis verecunda]
MVAKQYKKYSDVPKQYRWDLEDILQGKTLEEWIEQYKNVFKKRIANKDTKYTSIEAYLSDLKDSETQTLISYKIDNYLSNNHNINIIDPNFKKLLQDYEFLNQQLEEEFGSELNRFYAHIEQMKQWNDDPRLSLYKRGIEDLIEQYSHKLSDEVEEYIIKTALGEPDPHNIFSIITNSELDYGFINITDKKKVKLNPTNRVQFAKSKNKEVRKQAYINFWDAYYKHRQSLSETLYQHFKSITVEAKIRKYDSAVVMLTASDKVSDEILNTLFKQVSNRASIFNKFSKAYKKFYKAKYGEKMQKWDTTRDLASVKSEYSVEEAKEIVTNAMKPFGDEYNTEVHKAFNEHWIDYMPVNNKRSGAYSIGGTYGIDKKYILMNFDGRLDSIETLAHELGHSMHSYFSSKYQPLVNSQYPIFLAEIASIFNELMLFDYLLKTSDNDNLKFKILTNMITGFSGTVLTQVEWANYEYDLYKEIASGNASGSYETISEIYFKNSLKYKIDKKKQYKYKEKDNLKSIYVPHYYYGFYVYKYAIGQLVANYFFAKYKKEGVSALESYINNFLKAGCSNYPIEILKNVGVDLNSEDFYSLGFKYVQDLIDEWIKLGNKIFKTK